MSTPTNNRHQAIAEDTVSVERAADSKANNTVIKKQKHDRKPQVIEEETQAIGAEDSMVDEGLIDLPESPRYWSKLFWLLITFTIAWLVYATLTTVIEAWTSNSWFGIPLTFISLAFIVVLILLIKRERDAFKRVDDNAVQRALIKTHFDNNSVVGIHQVLKQRLARIKKYYPNESAQFEEAQSDRHSAVEYRSLLDNVLLSRLDKDADTAIKKASLSIAALVAISPHPALDAVLVLIRANMLIRKISQIYGLEPTGLSSLYLLKHSIISALAAAGVEEISTLLAEEISMGLTEKAAKFIAEGAVSSARLYRLGHLTKKITRPYI